LLSNREEEKQVLRSIVHSQCGVTPACHKPHKKTCYSLKQAYQLFPLSICLFSHWTIPGSCVSNITMLQGSCFSVRNYLCADKIRRCGGGTGLSGRDGVNTILLSSFFKSPGKVIRATHFRLPGRGHNHGRPQCVYFPHDSCQGQRPQGMNRYLYK